MMHTRAMAIICILGVLSGCAGADTAARDSSRPATVNRSAAGAQADTPLAAPANTLTSPNSSSPVIAVSPTPQQPASAGCKAGRYLGQLSGTQVSGALGGIVPVPFATMDLDGKPGFEFWLAEVNMPCAPGQEFCASVAVKSGKMRGLADPSAQNGMPGVGIGVRFEIDLSGELDCRTGEFRGRIENGCYDVFSILYRFTGRLDGMYDLKTSAFPQGSWQTEEQPMGGAQSMPAMPLVGSGTWSAEYRDASPPAQTGPGLCAGMTGLDSP